MTYYPCAASWRKCAPHRMSWASLPIMIHYVNLGAGSLIRAAREFARLTPRTQLFAGLGRSLASLPLAVQRFGEIG